MIWDDWKYYDANEYVIIVNTFADEWDDNKEPTFEVNSYVALKQDIEDKVSVHDVMKQVEEMS